MDATHHSEYQQRVEGAGDEHHEKTPVLQKVKEKVMKVRTKITKKKHGNDGAAEQERHRNDVSEGDEGYEDEEMEVDPEVHGAPMYGSGQARNTVDIGDETLETGPVSLGKAMAMSGAEEDPAVPRPTDRSQLLYPSAAENPFGERRNVIRDHDENIDQDKVGLKKIVGSVDQDPAAPEAATGGPAESVIRHKRSAAASDPLVTGRNEVGDSTILGSFQAMSVTGDTNPEGDDQLPGDKPPVPSDIKQDETEEQHHKTATYTGKIASTAAAAKDAAISAAIGSTEYGKKIASTVYEKVSELKPRQTTETTPGQSGKTDRGVSVKEYIAEKLKPGDDDRALSEAITSPFERKNKEGSNQDQESVGGGGKGVVEKIKGAVSSWLGAGSATPGKGYQAPQTDRANVKDAGKETSEGSGQSVDAHEVSEHLHPTAHQAAESHKMGEMD